MQALRARAGGLALIVVAGAHGRTQVGRPRPGRSPPALGFPFLQSALAVVLPESPGPVFRPAGYQRRQFSPIWLERPDGDRSQTTARAGNDGSGASGLRARPRGSRQGGRSFHWAPNSLNVERSLGEEPAFTACRAVPIHASLHPTQHPAPAPESGRDPCISFPTNCSYHERAALRRRRKWLAGPGQYRRHRPLCAEVLSPRPWALAMA
jgi:hypothetical protein